MLCIKMRCVLDKRLKPLSLIPNIFLSARQEILERADFLFRKFVFKVDGQLGKDDAPILATACPSLRYVHHGKVGHFQQTVICRE